MKPILEIKNISKRFMINHERQPYLSIRDQLANIFKPSLPKEEFWALKDMSFDVYPGESIGIIGKNGAGKSTLLKILSKITPPTSGKIISRGRIASLLEVGTGFHPELTGRENVYMNGSILGMRRKEIQKNFDAIVDFAGVEKFIDTPLKHYSSGMQLRLAFAVAAYLENEILIIDEVLAVGDAEFQKKCMGKMEDVSKSGRTVLFVSHNMGAVKKLCAESFMLKDGVLVMKSSTGAVINEYLDGQSSSPSKIQLFKNNLSFDSYFRVDSITLINNINNLFIVPWDCAIEMIISLTVNETVKGLSFGVGVTTQDGIPLFTVRSEDSGRYYDFEKGETQSVCVKIKHSLRAGFYNLIIGVNKAEQSFYYNEQIALIEVSDVGEKQYPHKNFGLINYESDWS